MPSTCSLAVIILYSMGMVLAILLHFTTLYTIRLSQRLRDLQRQESRNPNSRTICLRHAPNDPHCCYYENARIDRV